MSVSHTAFPRPGRPKPISTRTFAWYEAQCEGLGLEFLAAIEATLAIIQHSLDLFPQVYSDLRRALVRKFLYAVFYLGSSGSLTEYTF